MAVQMSLGGNPAGDGFLLAPLASTYDAELALWTTAGTAAVTLQASPNAAGLVFSQTSVSLSTTPTIVLVHATAQSGARGDTTIQVLDGAAVVATFAVTSIKHPVVNFKGRFEARFATQPAFYNQNAQYTDVNEAVGPGWTWSLEGEPAFVPAVGNVPENLETAGVGRVIRLNNPMSLRSHAAPVVSTVVSISGETSTGTETFLAGDPLIGQSVDFGPNTYFAGNRNYNSPPEPMPEEYYADAYEPMGLFELHFGAMFSGASQVGPFTAKATMINQKTRSPDMRPIATGLVGAGAEMAEFGLPSLTAWSETRIDLLITDYNALPAGPSPQRRNLARRIGHLLSTVSVAKRNTVQAANPGAFTQRVGTISAGWTNKEIFIGLVDTSLTFQGAASSVIAYFSEFQAFRIEWHPFSFHSDELCAHHKGKVQAHVVSGGVWVGDPHARSVNGITFDFQGVGEFTLLRDGAEFEVQVRTSPVVTATPITDPYSGLTACVSINTAVALRVGSSRVSLQPARDRRQLDLFVDRKPADVSLAGIDLGAHRLTTFDASGETGIRVDYENGTVVTVTPNFWAHHGIWYLDVGIANTRADDGIMGFIPSGSWLPRLRNGQAFGPMPAALHDRYVELYKRFANSWRVNSRTSLFVYMPGTSAKTFTDRDWPAEQPPCKVKPALRISAARPRKPISVRKAEQICNAITEGDLHEFCVFDVATTGDETFAQGYRFAQELRLFGTAVRIFGDEPAAGNDRLPDRDPPRRPPEGALAVTATVVPLSPDRPTPTGAVTFVVDGVPMRRPVRLDERGRARMTIQLKPGDHTIRALYSGGGEFGHHSSASPNLLHSVRQPKPRPRRSAVR